MELSYKNFRVCVCVCEIVVMTECISVWVCKILWVSNGESLENEVIHGRKSGIRLLEIESVIWWWNGYRW